MIDQLLVSDEQVSNWVRKSRTITSVTRIPGDASTRRYYRVQTEAHSYIAMIVEPFPDQEENYPFLAVQKHLSTSGIRVPTILDIDSEKGFILLEDLGDVTLLRKLQSVTSAQVERQLFEEAIDALVLFQVKASPENKGSQTKKKSLTAFKLKFDEEKLMWEVNFTIEHLYKEYLKRNLSDADEKIMTGQFTKICRFLAEQPAVLTHRDYHSRNIMVPPAQNEADEEMVMIDFQDARMGPPQYDLASLLKDSYYQLEESQISGLIQYYIKQYETLSGKSIDQAHFQKVFDLMSVQRNFKAIGSFASFLNKRGNASYLKYIGNTFENIRRQLLKYPEYSDLREVLFYYYYF